MSRSRDIAAMLGRTEANNAGNLVLLNTASEVGFDSADVTNIASAYATQVYATPDLLPIVGLSAGQRAFVTSNQRFYISDGSGWYNIALINATPTFTTGPDATYALSNDLTPTVITLVAEDSDGQAITYAATANGMDGIATLSQDSSVFTITPLTDSAGGNIGTFTLTFTATDGVDITSALSTFTLSFGPDWSVAPTETKYNPTTNVAYDKFGSDVKVNSNGTFAIVGAEDGIVSGQTWGAAYVLERNGSTWTDHGRLVSSDLQYQDYFGYAVAISDDGMYAVIGARGEDGGAGDPVTGAGAAYVFNRDSDNGTTWTQQTKLIPSNVGANYQFGWSVAMNGDGDYILVGAKDESTTVSGGGAVYVFTRSASTWTEQTILEPSDLGTNHRFGRAVAITKDASYAACISQVTASGGTGYVFSRSGSTWTQHTGFNPTNAGSIQTNIFDIDVDSTGSRVLVGAGGMSGNTNYSGTAFIFDKDSDNATTWTQTAQLNASDGADNDWFGWSAALSADGNFAVIGAWGDDSDGSNDIGAAYIFKKDAGADTWTQTLKLQADTLTAGSDYGRAVGMSGDGNYILVGAPDLSLRKGATFIYEAG